MKNLKVYLAEVIGTCALTLVACGVAVWTGVNAVATSLAFGLVIVAMAYSIGNVSGCHINPAVSLAMLLQKKITLGEFFGYVLSQIVGAFLGSLLLGLFLGSYQNLGGNAVQPLLNAQYSDFFAQIIALLVEVVLTFIFVLAILGVTSKEENGKVAGLVIGGALTLVHLLGLGFTGTSVNPARSLAPAVLQAFAGQTTSIAQIWIFIVGPLLGAVLAALVAKLLFNKKEAE